MRKENPCEKLGKSLLKHAVKYYWMFSGDIGRLILKQKIDNPTQENGEFPEKFEAILP